MANLTLDKLNEKLDLKKIKEYPISEFQKTYLYSYPYFISYFRELDKIEESNLIISSQFVYGWMPKTLKYNFNDISKVLKILNKVKKNIHIEKVDIDYVSKFINNSIVGTSKLFHFINPSAYPIIDSKIYNYLNETKKSYPNPNFYINYKNVLLEFINNNSYSIKDNLKFLKLDYKISDIRAIELLLFLKSISNSNPNNAKSSSKK